jgi:mannosyltransferase
MTTQTLVGTPERTLAAGNGFRIRERTRSFLDSRGGTPLIAGLFTFAIAAFRLTHPEVWYDETATITSASRSLGQLLVEARHIDAVHTLYYALMHVVFAVFGYSPLSLRLPSALAIGLAAAFTVVLARQFGDPRRALVAGLMLGLLPRAVWAGGVGRSYAGTALLAVLLTIILVKAIRSPTGRRWWIAYAGVAIISCLFFAFLVFLVLAHAITVLYLVIRERRRAVGIGLRWAIATAIAGVALVPFALLIRSEAIQVSWIGGYAFRPVEHEVIYKQWFSYHSILYSQLLWVFLLAGCVVLLWRSRSLSLGSVVVPAAVVPTIGMILYTIAIKPIYSDRYVTMCVPFIAILVASALTARLRWTPLIAVALVLFGVLFVPAYAYLRSTYTLQPANWEGAAAYVQREREMLPADTRTGVIWGEAQVTHLHTQQIIQEGYPQAFEGMVDVTRKQTGAQIGQLFETHLPLSSSFGRLKGIDVAFFLTARKPDLVPVTSSVMEQHGWHAVHSWSGTEIQVVEYRRDGTTPAA